MEEFEDMFEDHEDEISKMQQAAESQQMMEKIKDRLARVNYNAIVKYGIDVDRLNEPHSIKNIIQETLEHFEEIEEYEKCSKLKAVLDIL